MNQMMSMVGPTAHVGHGMPAGMAMEQGMGMTMEGHALSGRPTGKRTAVRGTGTK